MTAEEHPKACKKHPCPDCRSCQFCSDRRCELCQGWLVGCCGGNKGEAESEEKRKEENGTK